MKYKFLYVVLFLLVLSVILYHIVYSEKAKHETVEIAPKELNKKPLVVQNSTKIDTKIGKLSGNNKDEQIKNKILDTINRNDVKKFDSIFSSFLALKKMERHEKVIFLWNIAKNAKTDFVFDYTLDTLTNLTPIELTPEIIDLYYQSSKQRKIKLLGLLGDSLLLDSIANIPNDQLQLLGKTFDRGKEFFKNELYQTTDQVLFDTLFINYSKVASPKEVISDISQLFDSTRDTKISQQSLANRILTLVLEDQDLQNDVLPQILADNNKDPDFNNALSVLATELDPNDIIPSARNMISNRLSNNLRSISDNDLKLNDNQNTLVSNLEAIAKLEHTKKGVSKEALEVDMVINGFVFNNRPMASATSIVLSEDKTLNEYRKRKEEIIPFLENSLSENFSSDEKKMISEAIRVLQ